MDNKSQMDNPVQDNGYIAGGFFEGLGLYIRWQNGPLKEVGDKNGAFIEDVLMAVRQRLEAHNKTKAKCQENTEAIRHINDALITLTKRTNRREKEGTEGKHEGN